MCILFSYISKRLNPNEFKLIILNNRDEFHHRPSKPAEYVNANNVYAMDLTPGKEGGTWLGTSRLGKIAVLLNLNSEDYGSEVASKEGRGFLVPNFLNSGLSSSKYVESIKSNAKLFSPFNILFYEQNEKNAFNVNVFDNVTCELTKLDSEYVSISNHLFHSNHFVKTLTGEKIFKDIISKFNDINMKKELMSNLINLAKNKTDKKYTESMSLKEIKQMEREQICFDIPNYGTRTHTIILVDNKNRVTINETTMKCPIDSSNPEWEDNNFEFDLQPMIPSSL